MTDGDRTPRDADSKQREIHEIKDRIIAKFEEAAGTAPESVRKEISDGLNEATERAPRRRL